jgi:carboxylate-amine ligase
MVTAQPLICRPAGETLGVEEEYHLVTSGSGELLSRAEPFVETEYVQGELQASQLEIGTGVCQTLTELRAELVNARRAAADSAALSGGSILAAATHPFASWRDLERVRLARYDAMAERFGALAGTSAVFMCTSRFPTCRRRWRS